MKTLKPTSLISAARGAVIWGAGFTIIRDILQFIAMLILVRILTPEDYGRFAIANSIIIFFTAISAKNLVPHSLQERNIDQIPWQLHFTASTFLNVGIFFVALITAAALLLFSQFSSAAGLLALLSFILILEIPANISAMRLQSSHAWPRFRNLLMIGTFFGLASAITIAAMGGGSWALTAPPLLYVLPMAAHLLWVEKWRPNWSWDWSAYRKVFRFGATRVSAAGLLAGRQATEQAAIGSAYELSTLGVFTRAIGLATLLSGRVGGVLSQAVYPVITRADEGSARFERLAGLVLRAVAWATIPAIVYIMVSAPDLVQILYGPDWAAVAKLLPLAAVYVGLGGIASGAYSLILANNRLSFCLFLDITSAVTGIILVLWLIPKGINIYLLALAAHSAIMLTLTTICLQITRGIYFKSVVSAFVPPIIASSLAIGAVFAANQGVKISTPTLRLFFDGLIFGATLICALRILFPQQLKELVISLPRGQTALRIFRF